MATAVRDVGNAFYNFWRFLTIGRDLSVGQSFDLHRVLCAYAVKYQDPSYELPADVVAAAAHLTDQERAELVVLGEIGEEFRAINRRLEEEWAAMDEVAKGILIANAKQGDSRSTAFSKGMSLLESLSWGALTTGSVAWDLLLAFKGPDSSLLPRLVSLSAGTLPAAYGFLVSPAANRMQFFEAIFQDRVVLGTPQRIFYSAGMEHESFYNDKVAYITSVSLAASILLLGVTLPEPIEKARDNRKMNKIGGREVPEDELAAHAALAAGVKEEAERLKALEKKLQRVAEWWISGEGTDDQIDRIRSQTNREAELLLRATGQYVPEKHAEHGKKAGIVVLWNATIGGMLFAARNNFGQVGVLIPYIVHAERRMWEILVDGSQGAAAMVRLYARAGATAFYQFWFVSVPLLKRGSKAFEDPVLRRWITPSLTSVNLTIMQHTPYLAYGVGSLGKLVIRKIAGRKAAEGEELQLAVSHHVVAATGSAVADGDGSDDAVLGLVSTSPDVLGQVWAELGKEFEEPYFGDGQYLIILEEDDEGDHRI